MTAFSQQAAEAVLLSLSVADTGVLLGDVATIESLALEQGQLSARLTLAFPQAGVRDQLNAQIIAALSALEGVEKVVVTLDSETRQAPRTSQETGLAKVKNIIAVASGKGGVGKSTSAVNLALALAADGARVGILDADIYGPSVGQMLGVAEGRHPEMVMNAGQQLFVPIESMGLQSNSMAYLVTEQTPMAWRGPMASGALIQLLNQTMWGELDYLVIDMPPGTGDIQLTLAQKVPVAGSVIVTTPQDLALLDARKGIELFNKVDVPVLGILENMAVHICSECGHKEHLFGEGGGRMIAEDYKTELLGSLPLSLSIRQQIDAGCPTVASEPESDAAQLYRQAARRVMALLAKQNQVAESVPTISISDD